MPSLTRYETESIRDIVLIVLLIALICGLLYMGRGMGRLQYCMMTSHKPHVHSKQEERKLKYVNFCERCGLLYWEKEIK